MTFKLRQERINLRELIPADIVFRRALRGSFVEGRKVQKHVGSARVAMNTKQERIKRVYLR